ncbi:type II and III secretion system protein family protein [Mesorhizobium sp. BR1-1-16]|uniref:type II and III secretion system protein family protein n=1 Tax=Mesorhizobium sp. BR1-1-16 TaxID=2876653 RepID=UPI001CC959FA|nr:type II and III secretion system protein family protein [Mesorhizobium sp. BR1-1-16]
MMITLGRASAFGRFAMAATIAASLACMPAMAQAAGSDSTVSLPMGASQTLSLGYHKSKIIDLPKSARDVIVSDPRIATAVLRDSRRIFLTGVTVGQADLFVLDQGGQQILHLSLLVERDTGALQTMLNRLIPDSRIHVELMNDNIVLTGTVKNASDANKAQQLADMFGNGSQNTGTSVSESSANSGGSGGGIASSSDGDARKSNVLNLLTIEGEDQVQLKVTVAEIDRNVAKQLGVNITAVGGQIAALATNNPFAIAGPLFSPVNRAVVASAGGGSGVTAELQAMEQNGTVRILAEPTLTAISGEPATFLAGGEFPVPTGYDATNNQLTVSYKSYGISLGFTPIVLSEGRISLKVKTEASDISNEGAVSMGQYKIPSLKVRRAESTIELPSGGSLVLGGLLQDNIQQALTGFPVLMDVPILGSLFKSRDFKRNQTELVIIVTPYMAKPVARTALARPDDGFETPSDASVTFLGRLNRIYGTVGHPVPRGNYAGNYGFIYD